MKRRALMAGPVLLLLASSCAGGRNSLNTTASSCFRAISVAENAVHHSGRLVGVRHLRADALVREAPEAADLGRRTACAVAYRGDFSATSVTGASGNRTGPFAVVLVEGGDHLLGTYVVARLPVKFNLHH